MGAQRSVKDRRSGISSRFASTQWSARTARSVRCLCGPGVEMGDNVKIQNRARLRPARLGNGVFIGPAAVSRMTFIPAPSVRTVSSRTPRPGAGGRTVGDGAAIGARAVVRAGLTVGAWALVGAGAWSCDVPDYALVVDACRRGGSGEPVCSWSRSTAAGSAQRPENVTPLSTGA